MSTEDEDPLYQLARLAVQVALEAPLRPGRDGSAARIPWSTVEAIRAEADKQEVPWRENHRQTRKAAK